MEVISLAAIIAALLSTLAISIVPNCLLFLFPSIIISDHKNKTARNILSLGEALAAGALLGDVFLHTIPHVFMENIHHDVDDDDVNPMGIYILIGFTTFFVLDQLIRAMNPGHAHHQHHHLHDDQHSKSPICNGDNTMKDTHPTASSILLNLTGDSLHNFTDGLAIGASFTASASSTTTTTALHSSSMTLVSAVLHFIQQSGGLVSLSVLFHEIPHELGDYSILLMNGMTKKQAILAQFSTAIAAFLGTFVGLLPLILPGYGLQAFQHVLIPFTAGGFVYLAAVTILPDLIQYNDTLLHRKGLWIIMQLISFLSGIGFMYFVAMLEQHDHHHGHSHSHDHHSHSHHHHEL